MEDRECARSRSTHLSNGSVSHVEGVRLQSRLDVGVEVVIPAVPVPFARHKGAEAIDIRLLAHLRVWGVGEGRGIASSVTSLALLPLLRTLPEQ